MSAVILLNHITGFTLQRDEAANDRGSPSGSAPETPDPQALRASIAYPCVPPSGAKISIVSRAFLSLLFRAHRFDRAHVVQTVCKLDQDHTQIADVAMNKLAEILGLFGLGRA